VKRIGVLTRFLDLVHRAIGIADQFVAVVAMIGENRNADAGRYLGGLALTST